MSLRQHAESAISVSLDSRREYHTPHTDPSHHVEDTWSPDRYTDTRLPGEVAICSGSIACCLFVSEADEANTQVEAFLPNVGDR